MFSRRVKSTLAQKMLTCSIMVGLNKPETVIGGRIKGTLGDIDPLNKVPLKRARTQYYSLG